MILHSATQGFFQLNFGGDYAAAGGEHGNPLQYSSQENPMDRGAWWAAVHGGRKESTTIEQLSTDHSSTLQHVQK